MTPSESRHMSQETAELANHSHKSPSANHIGSEGSQGESWKESFSNQATTCGTCERLTVNPRSRTPCDYSWQWMDGVFLWYIFSNVFKSYIVIWTLLTLIDGDCWFAKGFFHDKMPKKDKTHFIHGSSNTHYFKWWLNGCLSSCKSTFHGPKSFRGETDRKQKKPFQAVICPSPSDTFTVTHYSEHT